MHLSLAGGCRPARSLVKKAGLESDPRYLFFDDDESLFHNLMLPLSFEGISLDKSERQKLFQVFKAEEIQHRKAVNV